MEVIENRLQKENLDAQNNLNSKVQIITGLESGIRQLKIDLTSQKVKGKE